ncbi:hypothetical protein OG562_00525 [Streptomyces sp. NBC_01275]|nr:hypothetical protein [Streptomyces sp. NBC_01275]MCX4759495.1 hypothetical protein [Streptomyces sp. NBC_01275]
MAEIEFDVPAEMRDGTVLRADVHRPGGTGRGRCCWVGCRMASTRP